MMRAHRVLLVGFAVASFSCAHSKTVQDNASSGPENPSKEKVQPQTPGRPPLAGAPQGVLNPGAVKEIQSSLKEKGFPVAEDGVLGERTEAMLASFQKKQNLPATGMPDRTTLKELGLDPDKIYRANPEEPKSKE